MAHVLPDLAAVRAAQDDLAETGDATNLASCISGIAAHQSGGAVAARAAEEECCAVLQMSAVSEDRSTTKHRPDALSALCLPMHALAVAFQHNIGVTRTALGALRFLAGGADDAGRKSLAEAGARTTVAACTARFPDDGHIRQFGREILTNLAKRTDDDERFFAFLDEHDHRIDPAKAAAAAAAAAAANSAEAPTPLIVRLPVSRPPPPPAPLPPYLPAAPEAAAPPLPPYFPGNVAGAAAPLPRFPVPHALAPASRALDDADDGGAYEPPAAKRSRPPPPPPLAPPVATEARVSSGSHVPTLFDDAALMATCRKSERTTPSGRKYSVFITPDGRTFRSRPEVLRALRAPERPWAEADSLSSPRLGGGSDPARRNGAAILEYFNVRTLPQADLRRALSALEARTAEVRSRLAKEAGPLAAHDLGREV